MASDMVVVVIVRMFNVDVVVLVVIVLCNVGVVPVVVVPVRLLSAYLLTDIDHHDAPCSMSYVRHTKCGAKSVGLSICYVSAYFDIVFVFPSVLVVVVVC